MNQLQMLQKFAPRTFPRALSVARRGRMKVDGRRILVPDANGVYVDWCGRGFNNGHGELTNDTDADQQAAIGATWQRQECHKWGTWLGRIEDLDDPLLASGLEPVGLARMVRHAMQAVASGQRTNWGWDSNCGQKYRAGDTKCMINGQVETFWTEGGQDRFQEHLKSAAWVARTMRGFIDTYEPVIEPDPSGTTQPTWPTGDPKTDITAKQEEFMIAVLEEDPGACFLIGNAPGYQTSKIFDWFVPRWVGRFPVIYTVDLLDNASTDPNLPARIANLLKVRDTYGVPVAVQQVGTVKNAPAGSGIRDDPHDDHLRDVLTQLNEAEGGSVPWTWWEWISPSAGDYGPWYGNEIQRNVDPDRLQALQDMIAMPITYPTNN